MMQIQDKMLDFYYQTFCSQVILLCCTHIDHEFNDNFSLTTYIH